MKRLLIGALLFASFFPANAQRKKTISCNLLKSKTFVLTGTLPTLSRKEASELIELHGGKTSSSVSNKTTYLIAGDAAGSKRTKAKSLGIPILDETALLSLIKD